MNTPAPAPRSNFVTVLAWVMIAFGAFSIFMALIQSVLVNMLLPSLDLGGPAGALPLGFIRGTMLGGLAFSVFMTYAAWALLKRRNWARILYIVVFLLSVVAHVLIAAVFGLGFSLVDLSAASPEFFPPQYQATFRAIAITLAILMLAMAVGYVWVVRRLCSPAIAAEFKAPGAAV